MPTIQQVAEGYVTLRNFKRSLEAKHKEELKPINVDMKKMEAFMLDLLNKQGAQNVSTAEATIYKSKRVSVKTENWQDFFEFVQANEAWHFLTKSVSKTMVQEYLEEEGVLPPGLSISTEQILGVRSK